VLVPKRFLNRIFKSTPEGDRLNTHTTVALFSRIDGHYQDKVNQIKGAPMPMIIHSSSKGNQKSSKTDVQKRMDLYLQDLDNDIEIPAQYLDGFDKDNPLGISVHI
jgi:hypothetical protein